MVATATGVFRRPTQPTPQERLPVVLWQVAAGGDKTVNATVINATAAIEGTTIQQDRTMVVSL